MDISRPRMDFRGSLLFSALLHASLLAVFFLIRPQVIEVAMPGNIPIDLESGPSAPAAAAPTAPVKVAPAAKPAPQEIKKDEVAEAHKKKKEPPKVEPKRPEPVKPASPSPAPPSASTNPSPGTSTVAAGEARIGTSGTPGTTGDSRLGFYLLAVRNKIGNNWSPPGVDRRTKASVFFKVDRRGNVTEIRLEQSSGSAVYDQLAVRAIKNAAPLPPLPDFFPQPELGVHFDFEQAH